jgi:hypothetical protein
LDAVGSAIKRWHAEMDWGYVMHKARFVPFVDLPYHGGRYFWNRIYRLVSRQRRLAFWGPKLDGMESLLQHYSLEEVCALQWQRCVDKASAVFEQMPAECFIEVGYEDFVRAPASELGRFLDFLGRDIPRRQIEHAVADVSSASQGRGRASLGADTRQQLGALVGDTLRRYGYSL